MSAPVPERLLVVGGRQARGDVLDAGETYAYERAVVVAVSTATRRVTPCLEYLTPPALRPDAGGSVVFKSASLDGRHLHLCTQTELLTWQPGEREPDSHWSHPWLNDVHHVLPRPGGSRLVANTGLDMILEVTADGHPGRTWSMVAGDPWQRFDHRTDFRKVLSTKPHAAHPNYLFEADGRVWATRFEQRDALTVDGPRRVLPVATERPHDGVPYAGLVWFTTVDGHLVAVDPGTGQVARRVDFNRSGARSGQALGWCRGLHLLPGGRAWVGFSRLRPTRLRQNLSWLRHGFRRVGSHAMAPSRIALYELAGPRLLDEVVLEDAGLNAVFSMHALQ